MASFKYSQCVLLQRVLLWLILMFLLIINKPSTRKAIVQQNNGIRGPSSLSNVNDDRDNDAVRRRSNHLACVKEVLEYLPVGRGHRRQKRNILKLAMMYSHHYDAQSGLWNGDERLVNLNVPPRNDRNDSHDDECTIWEVGAFKNARDSLALMPMYPHCKFHAFEPVPTFYQELERKFRDNPQMSTHNYGLGKEAYTFRLDPSILHDEGTFLKNSEGGTMEAKIQSFDFAIRDCGGKFPSVLQVNCEGCEWIFIPQAIESNFIAQVPIVQIGTHNYPIRDNETESIGRRVWQLCEMRGKLNVTHKMTMGVPFAWERWELRNKA